MVKKRVPARLIILGRLFVHTAACQSTLQAHEAESEKDRWPIVAEDNADLTAKMEENNRPDCPQGACRSRLLTVKANVG